MKGVQFHAVMPRKRQGKGPTTRYPEPFTRKSLAAAAERGERVECFALQTEDIGGRPWRYNPGGAGLVLEDVFDSIAYSSCSLDWLRTRTVRISEDLARKLHPELVAYMESD